MWHQSQHLPCWCRRGCSGCRLMRTSIAQTRFMKARWVDSDLAKEKWELGIFWNQLSLYYHLNDWISTFSSQSSYLPVQFGLDILGVGGAPCISAPPWWCPQEVRGNRPESLIAGGQNERSRSWSPRCNHKQHIFHIISYHKAIRMYNIYRVELLTSNMELCLAICVVVLLQHLHVPGNRTLTE